MKITASLLNSMKIELNDIIFFLIILLFGGYLTFFPHVNLTIKIFFTIISLTSAVIFIRRGEFRHFSYTSNPPNFLFFFKISIFLAALTWLAFYRPMLEHYWVGLDEPVLLGIKSPWFDVYDKCCSRPLAGLEAFIGNSITPGQINGLLIINTLCRLVTSIMIFLLVILLVPKAKSLAAAAGILMAINPGELLRFSPGLSSPYVGVVMFFMLASCLFIRSYVIASRTLLLLSCIFLSVSFLHYETIFPVSVLIPFLLLLIPTRPQRLLWAGAWYLTTLLFAIRFILFFLHGSTYQSAYTHHMSVSLFFENFLLLFTPLFKFISPVHSINPISFYYLPVVLGLATFILLILLEKGPSIYRKKQTISSHHRLTQLGLFLFSLIALALAILPETLVSSSVMHVPDFRDNPAMRLEFTTGPWQAIIWASFIGLTSSFLFWPRYWFAIGIAILVFFSVSETLQLQKSKGAINTYLDFQKESNILRNAAPLVMQLPINATVFFIIPDDEPSPFGWGYHIFHMSCLLFGRPGYAGHYSTALGAQHRTFPYSTPINQENYYVPIIGVQNLSFIHIDKQLNLSIFRPKLAIQPTNHSLITSIGPLGPCTVPRATLLANGDLPFLLPKSYLAPPPTKNTYLGDKARGAHAHK